MPKPDPNLYLPVETYAEAVQAFHGICGIILFEFARRGTQGTGKRDVIIRNFIARTDVMVRAIMRLWDIEDYQDCWILHRCLLDRYFHLCHLSEFDEFDVFEQWSFLQQYRALNLACNDPAFNQTPEARLFAATRDQKMRGRTLEKNPPKWQRPRAEEVAKRLGMGFLYRFGYDLASTHVHPMASDGDQDFFIITKLEPAPEFPDQRPVLSNTLLVGSMMVQQGLNASSLRWRALVYNILEDMRRFVGTGEDKYSPRLAELVRLSLGGARLADETSSSSSDGSGMEPAGDSG
jgi:hypothetical protein